MQNVERLSITLPADVARLIRAKVAEGGYASNSDVICEAMRAWQDQEHLRARRLTDVRARIAEADAEAAPPCPMITWSGISPKGSSGHSQHLLLLWMMLDLVYRHAALADLDAIFAYIEPDNPRRAASFVHDIRTRCQALCTHPKLGRCRDDLSSGIRVLPMLGRIIVAYRITSAAILVTRVFSGGQDYEAIMRRDDDAIHESG